MRSEDWLGLGLRRLSEVGPEALRLDAICEAAGRTKGSFYHHFKDVDAFALAMVRYWRSTEVTEMIARITPEEAAAMDAEATVAFVVALDYHLEIGLRELARRNQAVAAELRIADEERIEFFSKAYRLKFGLSEADARDLSKLDYGAFAGLIWMEPDMPRAEQVRLCALFIRMTEAAHLTSAVSSPASVLPASAAPCDPPR